MTQCTHGDTCNGYQPATLETLDYDFNGDGKTDENDKAYKITNAGQLYWFAAYVNQDGENLKANAYLANDITINENLLNKIQTDEEGNITNDGAFRKWVPIGDWDTNEALIYAGVFDGKECSIKGMYINETSKTNQGLFGRSSGTVKKLTVEDSEFLGKLMVGGIAGCNFQTGMITKCRFKGKVCSTIKSGTTPSNVGGICGSNNGASAVIECINEGTVVGYIVRIGGIAGQNVGRIERCENTGKVYNYCSKKSNDMGEGGTGGIVGVNLYSKTADKTGMVVECVNKAGVYGEYIAEKMGICILAE